MDEITKELRSFLVKMRYEPESVSDKMAHYLEHLFHLLEVDDEEAVLSYFGILGREQKSLKDIAKEKRVTPQEAIDTIDACLRRLAITPEWQMLKKASKTI